MFDRARDGVSCRLLMLWPRGLTKIVPFLVEDMLKKNGGVYSKVADWQSHVVTDGLLITGQNPASSAEAARALLKQLG